MTASPGFRPATSACNSLSISYFPFPPPQCSSYAPCCFPQPCAGACCPACRWAAGSFTAMSIFAVGWLTRFRRRVSMCCTEFMRRSMRLGGTACLAPRSGAMPRFRLPTVSFPTYSRWVTKPLLPMPCCSVTRKSTVAGSACARPLFPGAVLWGTAPTFPMARCCRKMF